MRILETGTLGTIGMSGTFEDFTGDAYDLSHLDDVVITLKGTADLDATAAMTLQYSQDATNWAATPASSACTYAAPSKSFVPTGRVKFVRGYVSACTTGSFTINYSGWRRYNMEVRDDDLGDLDSQTAGDAISIADLEKVIATVSNAGTGVVYVEGSTNGTTWDKLTSFTNTNGSYLIPLPYKYIRADKTSHSSGTAYCKCGGVKARHTQRCGSLGSFTGATTGTSTYVGDLDGFTVQAIYTDSGTFTAAATVLIEISSDASSWALAPGSSSFTSAGTLAVTAPAKYVRARCSSYTVGTVDVRFGGANTDLVG